MHSSARKSKIRGAAQMSASTGEYAGGYRHITGALTDSALHVLLPAQRTRWASLT